MEAGRSTGSREDFVALALSSKALWPLLREHKADGVVGHGDRTRMYYFECRGRRRACSCRLSVNAVPGGGRCTRRRDERVEVRLGGLWRELEGARRALEQLVDLGTTGIWRAVAIERMYGVVEDADRVLLCKSRERLTDARVSRLRLTRKQRDGRVGEMLRGERDLGRVSGLWRRRSRAVVTFKYIFMRTPSSPGFAWPSMARLVTTFLGAERDAQDEDAESGGEKDARMDKVVAGITRSYARDSLLQWGQQKARCKGHSRTRARHSYFLRDPPAVRCAIAACMSNDLSRRNSSTWGSGAATRHASAAVCIHSGRRTVDLVVLPAETLRDPDPPPLALGQQPQHIRVLGREQLLWQVLEHPLGQYHVSVLVMVVGISLRVVDAAPSQQISPLQRRRHSTRSTHFAI